MRAHEKRTEVETEVNTLNGDIFTASQEHPGEAMCEFRKRGQFADHWHIVKPHLISHMRFPLQHHLAFRIRIAYEH